ncbi:MAG: hypothetical protein LBG06_06310 [Deltaproteobacteria bacterium]|nr:hypothetical protein [Deltaproteobacteria bacterium]
MELSSEGGRILRLEGIRVLGPLAKGAPAPSQTIDLEGLAVYLSSPLLPSLAPPPALGGTRAAAGAQACGAGAAPVPEASRHPPLLLPRLAIEARYTERLGSVVVPSFTLEADGLFGISGSLVLLGAGRPFLEDLGRATLARPGTVLDAPSAGGISVAAFDLEYSDRGLARALLASAAARGAPGGSLDALASSLGILALARMDPFAVNAPEIVSELRDFALDPAGISFSFAAEEPLSLGTVRRVLLDPLLRDEGERDARAAAALLARLRVSLAVSGRRPVDVQWRDVPPAFMAGMSPTQTRHDGLGDLERR